MFNKIFGNKTEMYDVSIYWDVDVNCDDLVSDLEKISEYIMRSSAFKFGSRIVTVRDWWIDDTKYKTAELHCDKMTMNSIENRLRNKGFKAVRFMKMLV